jgi:hypothetical protein
MSNIKKQNNLRINLSSFSSIYGLKKYINYNSNYTSYKINNQKIINLNNFELKVKNKSVKYSTYYTNPHLLSTYILEKVKFAKTKNSIVKNLCKKIFLSTVNYELTECDEKTLNHIIMNKKKYTNQEYIGIEQCLLVLWYIIHIDKHNKLVDKQTYYDLIKYYYLKFVLNIFDFKQIIHNMLNTQYIIYKKFFVSFYILCEEFHFKYIGRYLKNTSNYNVIFNSNYIKINPQHILNNMEEEFDYNISSINEDISNPFGHNILFIKSNSSKVYYYDPDELDLSDIYKFKILFKSVDIDFFNISNRTPIQTITDDSNCVFYCLGLIKYMVLNNTQLELNKLKNLVLMFENFLLSKQINIFNWTTTNTNNFLL